MIAKVITIKPAGSKTDSDGWHRGLLKAFDSQEDMLNDKPKWERHIDSFDTDGRLKVDFEPNGKVIRIFPYGVDVNALEFDEYVYGPTIRSTFSEAFKVF